jgi:hypothetical protein
MGKRSFEKMGEPPEINNKSEEDPGLSTISEENALEVYWLPSRSDAETRGIPNEFRIALADFSQQIVRSMERFNEKYNWEIEINGEVKIFGVFSGSAKLKIAPK